MIGAIERLKRCRRACFSCFECAVFAARIPGAGKSSGGGRLAAPQVCASPGFSPSRPHCDVCGWAGVSLSLLPVVAVPEAVRHLQHGGIALLRIRDANALDRRAPADVARPSCDERQKEST